ncbi:MULTISPECIES: hypothetical protein [unclassified Leisingera]|nr:MULTISPECIES: hypothetical protein [unclassified Leisingera]
MCRLPVCKFCEYLEGPDLAHQAPVPFRARLDLTALKALRGF